MRLYHSPQTRSTRILWLLEELGVRSEVEVKWVSIQRSDGSSHADSTNPHPEGKVPLLDHDGVHIRESSAIVLYLTDLFPGKGLGRNIGDMHRGDYLSWLHYYGGVIEPVLTVHFSTMTPDDLFKFSFRGFEELSDRLTGHLSENQYLLGETFSAADLLISAPFIWFSAMAPDTKPVREWIARCAERPAFKKVTEEDLRFLDTKMTK